MDEQDVYFGDTEKPLPNWREEQDEAEDTDDSELDDEERAGVIGILGFDPEELWPGPDGDDDDSALDGQTDPEGDEPPEGKPAEPADE